jgi:hypothetical protein
MQFLWNLATSIPLGLNILLFSTLSCDTKFHNHTKQQVKLYFNLYIFK